MAKGKGWTREELLVALNLYSKLRFGQLHARQPVIVDLAQKLGRTPGSLAMKLSNFASLDGGLKARGIKGLEGASNLDKITWDYFEANKIDAIHESENTLRRLFDAADLDELDVVPEDGVQIKRSPPSGPTETRTTTTTRRGQDYFRSAVLNNFGGRCGITGLAVRELLVASHILPWGSNPTERLNVRNGLSLSRLHDAAFDRGMIAFDDSYRMIVSSKLKRHLEERVVDDNFGAYAGATLKLPADAIAPEPAYLARHRAETFSG